MGKELCEHLETYHDSVTQFPVACGVPPDRRHQRCSESEPITHDTDTDGIGTLWVRPPSLFSDEFPEKYNDTQ